MEGSQRGVGQPHANCIGLLLNGSKSEFCSVELHENYIVKTLHGYDCEDSLQTTEEALPQMTSGPRVFSADVKEMNPKRVTVFNVISCARL
jgi:hypothetical protein